MNARTLFFKEVVPIGLFFIGVALFFSAVEASMCSRPQVASSPPSPLGACSSLRVVSEDEAVARIQDFAPFVFFHPLEKYNLARVEKFLQNSDVFNCAGVYLGPATELNVLMSSLDPNVQCFFVSGKNRKAFDNGTDEGSYTDSNPYISGERFDEQGRSLAPIYATAYLNAQSPGVATWVTKRVTVVPFLVDHFFCVLGVQLLVLLLVERVRRH